MMINLSVVICTYNPRDDIFKKCLDHLVAASSIFQPYEIIIVDNNSKNPVENNGYVKDFVQKMPFTKIVVEKNQGLTPARLRGIRDSKGDLIVFIDDDNFITPDFFLNGIKIAQNWPKIGSWSGQVKLLFETTPPEWTRKYWGMLVYREFKGERWSNLPTLPETMPCGAGLFVRRNAADHYYALHSTDKRPIQLDRTASSLSSGGDNDLAACACDVGLGVGLFDDLVLEHYIPANRITTEYLLKLAEGIAQSAIIFRSLRGEMPRSLSIKNRVANSLRLLMKGKFDKQMQKAVYRGESAARTMIANSIKIVN